MENNLAQGGLLLAALVIALWLWMLFLSSGKRNASDDVRTLQVLLQSKETICQRCRSGAGEWLLTTRRLIIQEPSGYTSVPFAKIKRVQWFSAEGKRTSVLTKAQKVVLTAENEHTLSRTDDAFEPFVTKLMARIEKKNPRKKPIKTKRSISGSKRKQASV